MIILQESNRFYNQSLMKIDSIKIIILQPKVMKVKNK